MSAAAKPTPAERLEAICTLMREMKWERGLTGPKLAAEWGISVSSVERDASAASRIVRSAGEGDAR